MKYVLGILFLWFALAGLWESIFKDSYYDTPEGEQKLHVMSEQYDCNHLKNKGIGDWSPNDFSKVEECKEEGLW
jgi:hypothetical protein